MSPNTIVIADDVPIKSDLHSLDLIIGIAGSGYSKVGTCLLKDDYGDKIGALEKQYRSVTDLVEEIFHHWTAGKGATPISWTELVTCLRFAELNRLADDIESVYCAKERHGAVHKPTATDESKSSVMDEGYITWIYAIATVGAVIVTTCFIRYFTALLGIVEFIL